MKKIAILGSTGSIGTQALEVIRNLKDQYKIVALSANKNIDLILKQIQEFSPEIVVMGDESAALELRKRVGNKVEVDYGTSGLNGIANSGSVDLILNALVGMVGLEPTYNALKQGKQIALANKETLVVGGELITKLAKEKKIEIVPIDSEHCAIYQCLMGNDIKKVKKIILTASGGPFRGYSAEQLEHVTLEQALKHPNWSMGSKITVDSATMMNKGLEVIEAKWLFDLKADQIDIVVHPQSIVHSLVEYVDHSLIAQMGCPDMRIPIQFALTAPQRVNNPFDALDLLTMGNLTFEKPDFEVFECLELAYTALEQGGSYPVVLNAANEVLVELFLNRKINFVDIPSHLKSILEKHDVIKNMDLYSIKEVDLETRVRVKNIFNGGFNR